MMRSKNKKMTNAFWQHARMAQENRAKAHRQIESHVSEKLFRDFYILFACEHTMPWNRSKTRSYYRKNTGDFSGQNKFATPDDDKNKK